MAFNIPQDSQIKVKPESLIGLFEKYKGKTLCSLDTDTKPELIKKGRASGKTILEKFGVAPEEIHKLSHFSAGIGYEYAYVVMNRLIKDEKSPFDYIPGESWHVPYNNSTVIRKHKSKDDLYFFVTLIANNRPSVKYVAGDKELDEDALVEFLPPPRKPTNQGLDSGREVEVRTLKLSSVKKLRAEKVEFIVE